MRIAHFDVDDSIRPYLRDTMYAGSLDGSFNELYECITIKSMSTITDQILSAVPLLKLVITRTVGTDHIDLEACKKRSVAVYHIKDYGAFNIAEHALALLLAGLRNIVFSQNEVKRGVFSYKNWIGTSLRNKTIGVIGTGRIGLEFIKCAHAFDVKVIAYDIHQNEKASIDLGFSYVELRELFQHADIISVHAPLTQETKHMINEEAIDSMKQGVVLINTARGALVDTKALLKQIHKFKFVGLDVLEEESSFSVHHPLLKHGNVIITPHIGFFTQESVKKIAEETYACITNFKRGDSAGRVI